MPTIALTGILIGMFAHSTLFSRPDSPTDMYYTTITPSDAHTMSATFRNTAGYCLSGCKSKEGIFDLTEQTIQGLSEAMEDIKKNASRTPEGYRCIFGEDKKGETVIMLVPIDKSRNETLGSNLIRQVAGTLPCPTMCDIQKSGVVMGDIKAGQDCCN